jgi:hypothetical protein
MDQFKNMYSCKPKEYTSPLEYGDNPEVDTSKELDEEDIKEISNDERMLTMGCLFKNNIKFPWCYGYRKVVYV